MAEIKPLREKLWFIHGNLQTPKVWEEFSQSFTYKNREGLPVRFDAKFENLWSSEADSFHSWVESFCARVDKIEPTLANWIIAYSQGGRLALHAIIKYPSLWAGAVIIAADTGLKNNEDRSKQLLKDQKWGKRFLNESWQVLLKEWDELPIFGKRPNRVPRQEKDFNRKKIHRMYDIFSKGRQKDLVLELSTLVSPPILFLSGAEDSYYCDLGDNLEKKSSVVIHKIIPDAAHRVPWDNPIGFQKEVQIFLDNVARKRLK